ncbi:MAG: zinc-dependent metalloprotease [Sphingomonadales bacterium]
MRHIVVFIIAYFAFSGTAFSQKSFSDITESLEARDGLVQSYLDHEGGKILLALPKPSGDRAVMGRYIYAEYLRAGLGSNPVGLDRGQPGTNEILSFRFVGGKVIAEVENWRYIASSDNPREVEALRQSFATSIIWAGDVLAKSDDGQYLVDITSFLKRDEHGIASRLKRARQGTFKLDHRLSVVDTKAAFTFPDNIEFESLLTFTSDAPGAEVRSTTADPRNVTLIIHHSLIKLPDDGYRIRLGDDRAAIISSTVMDYATPLGVSMVKQLANRHRLQKINPGSNPSRVVKPIVYYVDNGTPEPVRSALIDGAMWWADAFEKAGFIDAYSVEVLPEDAHPLDIRYNMINWVHRQTRGWSYGGSVNDPRTGEIIKGNVLLGSLRVRQDLMIFEGLVGASNTGMGGANDPKEVALSRIRQLSAHEVGHTLGFSHNMGASTYMDRASVMDYPAPEVTIKGGKIDLSNAYAVGMGAWDYFTVNVLYSEFDEGVDEAKALNNLVNNGLRSGLIYVADSDSRPYGSGHVLGGLWDTGADAVASLKNTIAIRKIALDNFGLKNIKEGQPISDLNKVITPIYLFHRYQVEAASKPLGGLIFGYGLKGDASLKMSTIDPKIQFEALDAVLETLHPKVLDLSDEVLATLTPKIQSFGNGRTAPEQFRSSAYPAFDVLGAADVASNMTFTHLLHSDRLGRVVEFNRRDAQNPSLMDVLDRVYEAVFTNVPEANRLREIRYVVQTRYISHLIGLSTGHYSGASEMSAVGLSLTSPDGTMGAVVSGVDSHLRSIGNMLERRGGLSDGEARHGARLSSMILRHLFRQAAPKAAIAPNTPIPPGSPIGAAETCWFCDITLENN